MKAMRDLVFVRRFACRPSFQHRSLSRLAWEQNWHFDDRQAPAPKQSAYVRWMASEGTLVYLIQNWPTGAVFTYADGKDCLRVMDLLDALDVHTVDELIAAYDVERAPDPRMQLLFRLALAATPWGALCGAAPDPEVVKRLVDAGDDPARNVRYGAIIGSAFLGWTELDPMLARRREADPDDELKALSARVLTNVEHGRGG